MPQSFEDILENSIEEVLAGRGDVKSCCAKHPGEAGELRPLLELAVSGRDALAVAGLEISADARAAGRERVHARMQDRNSGRSWWRRHRPRRGMLIRPVALGAGAVLALSSGTALAATAAGPGSLLYPLEQKLEDVHTALTLGRLDKAEVEVNHANERLDELEGTLATEETGHIPKILTRYDNNINHATDLVKEAAGDGEDTGAVEGKIGAARDRLAGIIAANEGRLPEDARAAAREALKESDDDVAGLPGTGGSADSGGPAPAGSGAGSPGSAPGGEGSRESGETEHHGNGSDESHDQGSPGGSYEPPHEEDPHQQGDESDSHSSDSSHEESDSSPGGDSHSSELRGSSHSSVNTPASGVMSFQKAGPGKQH